MIIPVQIETILLALATAGYAVAMLAYWLAFAGRKATAGRWAWWVALAAVLVQAIWFGLRSYNDGHLPIYSGHDFSATFAGGAILAILVFEHSSQRRDLGAFILPVVLILLAYAWTLKPNTGPLAQIFDSYWLTIHILIAVIAYACFAATFAASCLYLIRARSSSTGTAAASPESLAMIDRVAYRVTAIGFPFMTFCIITGSIWADRAFGRYWFWDPKETWSLITWLLFAAYLHVRYHRGWNPKKAAVLAIIGFLTVLMNFIGVQIIYKYQETVFAPLMQ